MQQSVISARGAESQLARKRMLSHDVPTARAFFPHYPIFVPQ